MTLTEEERRVLYLLLRTVACAFLAMDDAEELHDQTYLVGRDEAERLVGYFELLEELPDDSPGYTHLARLARLSGLCDDFSRSKSWRIL